MEGALRIGVLVKDLNIQMWEYRVMRKLVGPGLAVIKMLIREGNMQVASDSVKYPFFYRFHEKLDRKLFRNRFDYDIQTDIQDLTGDLPVINGLATARSNKQWNDIDLVLNFGVEIPDDMYAESPRYGFWSFRVGDKQKARDPAAAYWETMKNLPSIEGTVFMHGNGGQGTVIYRTFTPTYPESINFVREQIYAAASVVIPRLMEGLAQGGDEYLEAQANHFKEHEGLVPSGSFKPPSSLQALANIFTVVWKKIGRKILYLNPDLWFIIISKNRDLFPMELDPGKFINLKPPAGKFWADPFVLSQNDRHYIFIEEYLYKTGKGHIVVLELDRQGALQDAVKIIDKPYHMSFPSIFEVDDKLYMIPETMENNAIELYRCEKFPGEWEFVMNLMEDIKAVDTTLFYHAKKWWLFTSIDNTETWLKPFTELFLFYSEDLFSGNWSRHPCNPIVTDLRTSRQAGHLFRHNGRIYRPAQDCSGHYGRAMKICEITKLDEQVYKEVPALDIEPDWNKKILGTHTINYNEELIVLDAAERARRINFKL